MVRNRRWAIWAALPTAVHFARRATHALVAVGPTTAALPALAAVALARLQVAAALAAALFALLAAPGVRIARLTGEELDRVDPAVAAGDQHRARILAGLGQARIPGAILGEPGAGEICINGAAAHLVNPGDLVIIASYAEYDEAEIKDHEPRLILVDRKNRPQLAQAD